MAPVKDVSLGVTTPFLIDIRTSVVDGCSTGPLSLFNLWDPGVGLVMGQTQRPRTTPTTTDDNNNNSQVLRASKIVDTSKSYLPKNY